MSTWNANVPLFEDGTSIVDQDTVNPVIEALAARDQYLFEMLNNKSDKTVLISYNQPIALNTEPGTPVYFDTSGGQAVLKAAKGGYTAASGGHLVPAPSAFIFGIVQQIYAGQTNPVVYGDVYIRGLITDIDFSVVLDTQSLANGTLQPGPLYLSSSEAGKLSIYPSGAAIFVGYFIGSDTLVLAPNIDSLNQLYFNYRVYLRPRAAGTPAISSGTTWTIGHGGSTLHNDVAGKVGWITANNALTELLITPPAGAKFFYSQPADSVIIGTTEDSGQAYYLTPEQKLHALQLKNALPAYPAAYTMVFLNGVLQTAYDADHTDGAYIIDENGIWWMLDQTNYVPWSGSPGTVNLQVLITKLNPNFADSVVTSLKSHNDAIEILGASGEDATSGNLTIKLALPITTLNTTGTGLAVQSLDYSTDTGITTAQLAPVVNNIVVGPGLVLNSETPGKAILSLTNFSLSGEIEDIEPEEADFVYKGLHSYLRLKNPQANQKLGFIGKFKVPDSIPDGTPIAIKLVCFSDSSTTSTGTTATFTFDYATSTSNSSITNAVTSGSVSISGAKFHPTVGGSPATLVQTTVHKGPSNVSYFSIPSSAFSAGSYVNFRIARTNSSYTNALGIIGVQWVIE